MGDFVIIGELAVIAILMGSICSSLDDINEALRRPYLEGNDGREEGDQVSGP